MCLNSSGQLNCKRLPQPAIVLKVIGHHPVALVWPNQTIVNTNKVVPMKIAWLCWINSTMTVSTGTVCITVTAYIYNEAVRSAPTGKFYLTHIISLITLFIHRKPKKKLIISLFHWLFPDVACHHRKPFVCEENDALLKYVRYTNPDTRI